MVTYNCYEKESPHMDGWIYYKTAHRYTKTDIV